MRACPCEFKDTAMSILHRSSLSMDQRSTANNDPSRDGKELPNTHFSTSRASLQINDRRDSLSRTLSPIAFFHHSVTNSETDLHYNSTEAVRRARAIATAPRRKRYDDDDEADIDEKRNLPGLIQSSPVLIPTQLDMQQTQSLPQTSSGINLIPSFRIDPPERELSEPIPCTDCHRLFRNRHSSARLPSLYPRRY